MEKKSYFKELRIWQATYLTGQLLHQITIRLTQALTGKKVKTRIQ